MTVVLWGGYAWHSIDDGPPGCEAGRLILLRQRGTRRVDATKMNEPIYIFTWSYLYSYSTNCPLIWDLVIPLMPVVPLPFV